MNACRAAFLVIGLAMAATLAGCGVKDNPEPPSGRKTPVQVYPKPDAMPGAPAPAPAPPAAARRS